MTTNKRTLGEFQKDNEMQDSDEETRLVKQACLDMASIDWDEVSYNQFVETLDNPDLQAELRMPPPNETTQPTEQLWPDAEDFGLRQLELDDLDQPVNLQEYDAMKELSPPPGGIGWEDDSAQTGGLSNDQWLAQYELPVVPQSGLDSRQLPIREARTAKYSRNDLVQPSDASQGSQWHIPSQGAPQPYFTEPHRDTRGRYDGIAELPGFLASSQPLPAGITLDQICWSYPNHLKGANLRPFIASGWTGRRIWDKMQDAAKFSSSAKHPWNKMVRRLQNEKKRMEAENSAMSSITTANPGSQNGLAHAGPSFSAEQVMQPTPPILFDPFIAGLSGSQPNVPQKEAQILPQKSEVSLGKRPVPVTDAMDNRGPLGPLIDDADISSLNKDKTDLPPTPNDMDDLALFADDLNDLGPLAGDMADLGTFADDMPDLLLDFHLELLKQTSTIFDLLRYRHLDWLALTKGDHRSRIRTTWLTLAREHEERFAEQNGIEIDNLPYDCETEKGMLERLQEMLIQSYGVRNIPENDMSAEDLATLRESLKRMVLESELLIVQGWTRQLEQQLEAAVNDHSSYADSQQLFDFDVEEAAFGEQRGKDCQAPIPTYPDLLPGGQVSSYVHLQDVHGLQPSFQQPVQVETSNGSGNIGTANLTTSSPPQSTTRAPASRRYGNHLIERTPTGGPGAPRIRMFPSFPDRDVPLTDEDLADLDNILDNFPDHLTLPSVMLRFCRPEGSKDGGYPTKQMVKRLLKHPNANDPFNSDEKERERALYHWTAAQKARANMVRNRYRRGASKTASRKAERQPSTNAEVHGPLVQGVVGAVAGPSMGPSIPSMADAHTDAHYPHPQLRDESLFEVLLQWPADLDFEGFDGIAE